MKMSFAGMAVTSQEWLAIRGLLFGVQMRNGYVVPLDFVTPFWCDHCHRQFFSVVTPEVCPNCKAEPGEQAMTLTHKGHTQKTFAFYAPLPTSPKEEK